jgi:signal transduction histidine kinase
MGGRQDEIADLAGAFDRMAERLERAFNAQRQLLSDASHELRSLSRAFRLRWNLRGNDPPAMRVKNLTGSSSK